MIYSMTGYGEAEGQIDGLDYRLEIKAVNNRYLRTEIRVPDALGFLEEEIERLLRKYFLRGTVSYTLRVKGSASKTLVEIDETGLCDLVRRLDRVRSAAQGTASLSIDLATLLTVPDMVRPTEPSEEEVAHIKSGVLALSQQAIERLKEMRAVEGGFLDADLQGHCQAIAADLEYIQTRRAMVLQEYAQRLRKRVDEMLAEVKLKLDEETLAREVAILAERSDISEEIARLQSHLSQFEQARHLEGEQVGRRLDFISQEMFREANTIASKASDNDIARRIVDVKCRIDRIKEQVQNVE
jgi:uncharacterized protein (TIGR00255 family)